MEGWKGGRYIIHILPIQPPILPRQFSSDLQEPFSNRTAGPTDADPCYFIILATDFDVNGAGTPHLNTLLADNMRRRLDWNNLVVYQITS